MTCLYDGPFGICHKAGLQIRRHSPGDGVSSSRPSLPSAIYGQSPDLGSQQPEGASRMGISFADFRTCVLLGGR